MAPPVERLPLKRRAISDQQRRRDIALLRQAQARRDAQNQARFLASAILSDPQAGIEREDSEPQFEPPGDAEAKVEAEAGDAVDASSEMDVLQASKLRGPKARRWFSRQLMLPEWMIDVPARLSVDWYVFPRPAGKRCFVVSSNGTTVSRLRNGTVLHHFPSALPNGARTKEVLGPASMFCILDCVFHEPDQTYYVIDMICWRGYSLYDCTAEFRFFWLNSKLAETGACHPPSFYHKYRFSAIPVYDSDQSGILAAYTGHLPFTRDGLLFYNKHAHYQTGNTPLSLVWKDQVCSQYFIDTDSKGVVPPLQQVVLELLEDGSAATSDDPPVVLGKLDLEAIRKDNLHHGNLLRFAIGDGGVDVTDGDIKKADIHFIGKANRVRAFADTSSKILFQYMARRSPLRIDDLVASATLPHDDDGNLDNIDMVSS
ncbi:unnamed protein product [Victoria cruziana]